MVIRFATRAGSSGPAVTYLVTRDATSEAQLLRLGYAEPLFGCLLVTLAILVSTVTENASVSRARLLFGLILI